MQTIQSQSAAAAEQELEHLKLTSGVPGDFLIALETYRVPEAVQRVILSAAQLINDYGPGDPRQVAAIFRRFLDIVEDAVVHAFDDAPAFVTPARAIEFSLQKTLDGFKLHDPNAEKDPVYHELKDLVTTLGEVGEFEVLPAEP